MLGQKGRHFNKIECYMEGTALQVALAHSEGVSIYDKDAHKIAEYLIGDCNALKRYREKLYVICNNKVLILANNAKISALQEPHDLAFMHDELYVIDALKREIVVYESDTLNKLRHYALAQRVEPSALVAFHGVLYFVDAKSSLLCAFEGDELKTLIGEDEHLLQNPYDLCVGEYGDGCGGGRIFIADTFNKEIKVYEKESHSLMRLCECEALPYSITKSGCNLYIMSKQDVIKFNISTMKSEIFLER